jgi:ABC-type polysaccharide/polyol phosphate export permease
VNHSIFHDIREAFGKYLTWWHLGVLDLKQRYRRSILGPWWITINMLIFIGAMGIVFGRVLSQNLTTYFPFFTTGFLLWSFVSSTIIESTEMFKMHSGYIKQMNLPFNLYALKFFTKNFLIFAHNFVVYFIIIAIFRVNPGWAAFLAIPGIVLLLLNLYWISLLVALISTRFRDMVPLVTSSMQLLFFVTPISWMPKLVGENSIIVKFNPIVYFIDVIRSPLLGELPPANYWIINCSIAVAGILGSLTVLRTVKPRIAFWID